jgi:MFS family permease
LNDKNFTMLVIGQTVTLFGSALLRFVLSLSVLDMTGRADIFSMLYAISAMPLLFSPIGGAIADRFNRRNLMAGIDFANGMITLAFIALTLLKAGSLFAIGAVMVLLGITSAMDSPAVMACIPSVVREEKLEQANGTISGIGSLAQVIAPVLGGAVYGIMGLNPLLIISCVSFFLASIMERFIQIPFTRREQEKHIIPTIMRDMKAGFAYTGTQPVIRKCVILAAVLNLCLTPFFIVGLPVILRVTMKSSDALYGVGMAITEAGMILGALTAGLFSKKMRLSTLYRWLIAVGVLIVPLAASLLPSVLGLGYYPPFALFFLFALPVLMILTALSLYVITRVQKKTPNELLGKVMAIITAAAQCAAPVGQIACGFLFEAFRKAEYIPTFILSALTLLIAVWARTTLRNEEELSNGVSV